MILTAMVLVGLVILAWRLLYIPAALVYLFWTRNRYREEKRS